MSLLFPLLLFYIFLCLDIRETRKWILPNARNEANPIARILFRHTSLRIQNTVHLLYAGGIAYAAFILPAQISLWGVYSFAVGHFLGFLSWKGIHPLRGKIISPTWMWFGLVIEAGIVGYLISLLHISIASIL